MATSKAAAEMSNETQELNLTPMIDISFLMIIFFMCLPFKTLEGKLQAFLPTDKGINPTPQEPPVEIRVSVHIVARKEEPGTFGPKEAIQQVSRPTEFKYRYGDSETADLKEVSKFIKSAMKQNAGAANTKVLGEIKAGHKVPHKYVIAVLNKFAEAGMEKVDFYGTQIPPKPLRAKVYLPFPAKNYETAD
jgi:biopolymer transport protein ExbD